LIPGPYDEASAYWYSDVNNRPIPIPDSLKISCDNYSEAFEYNYGKYGRDSVKSYIGPSLLFYRAVGEWEEQIYDRWQQYERDKMLPEDVKVIRRDIDGNIHVQWRDSSVYAQRHVFNSNLTDMLRSSDIWEIEESRLLKSWLREGQADSLYALMRTFATLQQKHQLKIDLTSEEWLKRIYHPPFFPVSRSTVIYSYDREGSDITEYPYSELSSLPLGIEPVDGEGRVPYLQHRELVTGYEHVHSFYEDRCARNMRSILLFALSFAMGVSLLVFSFRVTERKSWLIALVATGVLAFVIILFANVAFVYTNSLLYICWIWLALFVILFTRMLLKINRKEDKGRSTIYLNIVIWYIPWLIPLFLLILESLRREIDGYYGPSDQVIINLLWINLLVMLPAMWFISHLVRKWKGLAEE
jgi:hypothetical protein